MASTNRVLRLTLHLLAAGACLLASCEAHSGHTDEGPPCDATDNPVRLTAPFVPGTLTVDGKTGDWDLILGAEVVLRPALGYADDKSYPQGDSQMSIKVAHDGQSLYVLLKAPGAFTYSSDNHHLSVSAALMFGIGDDATLYNMGGCPRLAGACAHNTCSGHEVDLVHWKVDAAIPGRLYGRNVLDLLNATGADRIGKLADGYAFNPHCRFVDQAPGEAGLSTNGTAENDWVGVWSHTAVSIGYGLVSSDSPYGIVGESGHFIFELSRPLRTTDHFQQDVQLTIGDDHRFGAALWYPLDGMPWQAEQHFIASCDWAVLTLAPAPVPMYGWSYSSGSTQGISTTAATALSGLAILMALAAVFVSIVVGWWVRANTHSFRSLDNL